MFLPSETLLLRKEPEHAGRRPQLSARCPGPALPAFLPLAPAVRLVAMSFGGATCKARGARAMTSARAAKVEKVEEPASPVDEEARAAEAIDMMEQQLDRYMGRGHYPIAPGSFGPCDFGFDDHVAERLGRWWRGKILLARRWDARACCIVFLSAARRLLGADRRTSASGGAQLEVCKARYCARSAQIWLWAEPTPTFGPERLASGQARPAPKASRPAPKENFETARLRP